MCVLFIAKNVSTQYPLIIIANRDEFYQRPAKPIAHWQDSPIVAGLDLEAGGTWLGVTAAGKISALTNIRDPKSLKNNAQSRGELVTSFLVCDQTLAIFKSQLQTSAASYNGYNLLFGDKDNLQVFHSATQRFTTVNAGIHGLSNAQLNSPWPKVTLGKQLLTDYLINTRRVCADELVELLRNNIQAPDQSLPDTGIPLTIERALSPLFINSTENNYGTRCTSVLLFSPTGGISFHEVSYDAQGEVSGKKQITL